MEGRDLDWTRRGPLPGPPERERRIPERSSFGRNMDAASDAGSDRGGRRSNFESDGKFRDFGNWERKGPLSPPAGPPPREGGRPHNNEEGGSSFRRSSPAAWGEGRSQDGSRPPRPDRPERAPTASEMDNQWRTSMRPDQQQQKEPTSPTAPATRPKLNLTKRTVSETPTAPTAGGDSKASPFGAARPIDTATREREVEQKRQLAVRQKKDHDEKAKPEKTEKAEKAEKTEKTEKAEKTEKPKQTKEQTKENKVGTDSNKDAVEPPRGGGNFEILRRAGGDDSMPADQEPEQAAAPAPAEAAKESTNGNWRGADAPADEDDGWSTVGAKPRNTRRGGGRGF